MQTLPRVMLCASQQELDVSSSFALSADEMRALPWLTICSDAAVARQELRDNPLYEEAWVSSSDEVAAINLAAAIKLDTPRLSVYLVQRHASDSLAERASRAGIDGILSPQSLVWRCETHATAIQSREDAAFIEQSEETPEAQEESGTSPEGALPDGMPLDEAPPGANPPVPAEPLGIASVDSALHDRGAAPLPADSTSSESLHSGYLLSVISGSGGTGTSTVAALLAHLAQRRGLRTAVIDGDLWFGDMAELCGTAVRIPVESLLEGSGSLASLPDDELVVITAPERLEAAEAVAPFFAQVVQRLLEMFDLVVVNTGGPWEEPHAFLLETGTTTLFLIDQRASSVRACRHALDLCLRCGIATGSILLALNRCGKQAPFSGADVSSALEGARVIELSEGGREVEELMGSGLTDALVCSGNSLCRSIDRLIDEILPSRYRAMLAEQQVTLGARQMGAPSKRRGGRRRQRNAPGARKKDRSRVAQPDAMA